MKRVYCAINSVSTIGIMVLLMCFTVSCVISERYSTSVQVLVPPTDKINLPDSVSLAIVASVYSDDSRTSKEKTMNMPDDSSLIMHTAIELKEYLEDSPRYKGVDLPVFSIHREGGKLLTNSELNDSDLDEILEASNVDFLLSVEYVNINPVLYAQGRSFDEEVGYYNYVEMMYPIQALFRIYDTRTRKVVDYNVMEDTLRVQAQQGYLETIQDAVGRMPKPHTAVFEASQMIAESYISRIAPHWENVRRYFYSDNSSDMDLAAMQVSDEKWKEATDIWLMYVDDSNSQRAAMASFNLALASEMAGNYELAIEWLQHAKHKNQRYYSTNYEEILKRRIIEKNQLLK